MRRTMPDPPNSRSRTRAAAKEHLRAKATVTDRFRQAMYDLLRSSHRTGASALAATINEAVRPLGVDVTVYLADYEQRALRPLAEPHKPLAPATRIEGTLAGRAFSTMTTQRGGRDPDRLWVPVLDGNASLGVLAVALPDHLAGDDDTVRDGCAVLAGLVGQLMRAKAAHGDSLETVRRTRPMSHAAELLWMMLPPLTYTSTELILSAVVEPCYEVGGDAFDYAVDAHVAQVSVLDAVGHGLRAGLTCAVALAAMRAARRDGHGLAAVATAADAAITAEWTDVPFVTAIVAELDLETGRLGYVNAGHPPPLLLRAGRAVRVLDGGRRLPFGFNDPAAPIGQESLQPGDQVLFYTDGVTEARDAADLCIGLTGLVDLVERHAAARLPTPETVRRLARSVLDRQGGHSQDDATLLLLEWSPAAR
jgi:sigma-B regulation protein RsbU (phosphoserine phosphatase)